MRARLLLSGAPILCAAAACPAQAAEKVMFDVPAGSLNAALITFATQARISIDTGDPALRSVRVRELRGRFTIREGLQRLLRGTGFSFRIARGNVVRIYRQRHAQARPDTARQTARAPLPSPRPAPPQPLPPPIIVTASKRNVALADYAGSINVASFDVSRSMRFGGKGSELLLRDLPNLTSTDLGSGRNKIFVRGIADSSFNGQLQATVSQYLGESRLTYSAPDPDLALYDIEKVEVVEGPQGTLYGAGSLGGVIRIMPRSPEPGVLDLGASAALSVTGNEIGRDAALVANIPIGERAAVRVVGYHIVRPGYIDDVRRDLSDVNRTKVSGLRATFRMEFHDGLSIDAGIVSQDTGSEDGQYTDAPHSSALTRRSFVAQPFDNDYRLMFATLRTELGFASLVSNTSYTIHPIDTVFDATPPDGQVPITFKEAMRVKLLTHETRISGSADWITNWVSGFSFAHNINRIDRLFGPADSLATISNVQSETLDAAFFGEATLPVWRNVSVTGGGRLSLFTRFDEFRTQSGKAPVEPAHPEVRFLPTFALSWKPWRGTIGYVRYQEGFRPGAQQLAGSGDQTAVTRFDSDEIRTTEAGFRFGTDAGARFSGGVSYSYSRWNEIQADLVTTDGFPYIANIGSGFVRYASIDLRWLAGDSLELKASGFLTTSQIDRPAPSIDIGDQEDIPNIADSGWRLSGRYTPLQGSGGVDLSLDASLEFTGASFLAVGDSLGFRQGDFFEASAGARAGFGRWGVSIDVENLLDSRANRFSYGNPFSVAAGNQKTPLRPRTVRIGVDARF